MTPPRGQEFTPDAFVASVPPTPAAATAVFGSRVQLAERYVALLADTGISHGLIGPREAPRLWDRHVLNCAVVEAVLPDGASVIDIGSGAGLPGLVLAIVRPDLHLHLVEPLARRTTWLESTVDALGLDNVTVHRARAEAVMGELVADCVTARAVTALPGLIELAFPLLRPGGSLVALKGASAAAELTESAAILRRFAVASAVTREVGVRVVDPPTTLVIVTATAAHQPRAPRPAAGPGRSSRGRERRNAADSGRGRRTGRGRTKG